jgi:hypothetical protein
MDKGRGCSLKSLAIAIGVGFGLTLGGGFVYALFMDQTTRYVTLGIALFVLGCLITGTLLSANNYLTIRALSPRQEKTSYHFTAPRVPPAPPYGGPGWEVAPRPQSPALGSPWTIVPDYPAGGELNGTPSPRYLPARNEDYDEGDEVVA